MSLTRTLMLEVARHQLQGALRHPRPVTPDAIKTTTKGRESKRLQRMFARQNREANDALVMFWRSQVDHWRKS